jgi:hypothetical protein
VSLYLDEYSFEYIDTNQELRNTYDKSYNEMQLFACGTKPDIEQLKKFCVAKRKTVINGYWHVITFLIMRIKLTLPNFRLLQCIQMQKVFPGT